MDSVTNSNPGTAQGGSSRRPGNRGDKMKVKKALKSVVRVVLTLSITVALVAYMFHKVDFKDVWKVISDGDVRYYFLFFVPLLVMSSLSIRGYRWGMQLEAAGAGKIKKIYLFCSIYGAYALNTVIPYSGEAWRIVWIAKKRGVPVSTVLGTDIGDRGSDAVAVIVLTLFALIVGHEYILRFLNHYAIGVKFVHLMSNFWFWSILWGRLTLCIIGLKIFRNKRWAQSIIAGVNHTWHGFAVIFTMKGRGMYVVLTFALWGCNYLETYLAFYAFPFTREFLHDPAVAYGFLPALISFVFSSMSIAIPSNGGLGPWNLAVMFGLSLFGIDSTHALAFSMVLLGFVIFSYFLLGLFALIYILATSNRHTLDAPSGQSE